MSEEFNARTRSPRTKVREELLIRCRFIIGSDLAKGLGINDTQSRDMIQADG